MEILEGAMAFSVVMIVLATVVTGITEAFLRLTRRRQAMLAQALEQMLDEMSRDAVGKHLKRETIEADDDAPKSIWENGEIPWHPLLVDHLTMNDAVATLENRRVPEFWYQRWILAGRDWIVDLFKLVPFFSKAPELVICVVSAAMLYLLWKALGWPAVGLTIFVGVFWIFAYSRIKSDGADISRWRISNRDRVDELSLTGFAERLVRVPPLKDRFDKMVDQAGEADEEENKEIKAFLGRMVAALQRYKALSSERFRKYAQMMAIWIAMVVAIVFNIDAGRIFLHVMTDEKARNALIENAPALTEDWNAYLESRLEEAEESGDDNEVKRIKAEIADLQETYAETLQPLVEDRTLPVGFDYFPHCRLKPVFASFQENDEEEFWKKLKEAWEKRKASGLFNEDGTGDGHCEPSKDELRSMEVWFANALIAGVLIGLGGPFWYRVFDGLSRLSRTLGRKDAGNSELLSPSASETETGQKDGANGQKEGKTKSEADLAVEAALKVIRDRKTMSGTGTQTGATG